MLYLIFLLMVVLLAKVEGVQTHAEEEPVEEKKNGRGRKRKATSAPKYNDVSSSFIHGVIWFPIF